MSDKRIGAVGWMAKNKVAANLLMILFLVGGYFSIQGVKQEVFPEIETNSITVSVSYPGSGTEEIEEGVLQSVESAIEGLDGIKEIRSIAVENSGKITAELIDNADKQEILQDIKNAIDSIRTFPEGIEIPRVRINTRKRLCISVIVYGNQTQRIIYDYAKKVKKDLISSKNVTLAEIDDAPKKEISIEISQEKLQTYNLTLEDISRKIRQFSREVPVGSIKENFGEILIKLKEKKHSPSEFGKIPIFVDKNNKAILLEDIAEIKEVFSENSPLAYFNRLPAQRINIYSVGKESPILVAKAVKKYIKDNNAHSNIKLQTTRDLSASYESRINLLLRNSFFGLTLVLLILGLFLDIRLAFWVMLGLPISILGSFIFFQFTGATLNMVSLFAFLITLGIVVDDAIIIGESVYKKREEGMGFLKSAIWGAKEMTMPITFAILTNVVAFLPLIFVPGTTGDIFVQIPSVVISVLIVSLIESLFILPAHLSHKQKNSLFWNILNIPQRTFEKFFQPLNFIVFKKIISILIKLRYLTIAACLCILIASFGLIGSGKLKFSFLPKIDRDSVRSNATLPLGSPQEKVVDVMNKLVEASFKTAEENGGRQILVGVYSSVKNNKISIVTSLVPLEKRSIGGTQFSKKWRQNTPFIPEIESINFSGRTGFGGNNASIQLEVIHPNYKIQENIAKTIAKQLKQYQGVVDLSDGIELGKQQFSLKLKPLAKSLNISTNYLASQIRGAFYGLEAIRQQKKSDEYKVMVRYTKKERHSLSSFENFLIKTPQGGFTELKHLAHIKLERSLSKINRLQGLRILTLTADVDENKGGNISSILDDLRTIILPEIKQKFPSFSFNFSGEEEARNESIEFLKKAFLVALIGIYALIAIPFNSYIQPIAVMLSIPFGVIGAILGHWLLGYNISIISIIGIVGLTGIVINDSLILVVSLNRIRQKNKSIIKAAIEASVLRFRPILLTSITTFMGLLPMLFEKSLQARFLIPMAISISFGIIFATVIILALVPCIYIVIDDFSLFKKKNPHTE